MGYICNCTPDSIVGMNELLTVPSHFCVFKPSQITIRPHLLLTLNHLMYQTNL